MKTISFSENWNNKLNNEWFSTIRPECYDYEDGIYRILTPDNMDNFIGDVKVKRRFQLHSMPSHLTYLDAGTDWDGFMNIMENYYRKKDFWKGDHTEMVLLLIRKVEERNEKVEERNKD